ncbi:MAG: ABC transporter ATP-binding protein [Candidatus Brockarchaeota archaeon]|nr:ABC transporter ATP-binding protein [Candidatus Brockarchaeota archaeon]
MRGIVKRFPTVTALDSVDFKVRVGEIHALLGENGAGKTTLMRILYGMYRPDAGEIFIEGRKVSIGSPRDALRMGIGMVHQHFMLVDRLTVLENIALFLEGGLRIPFNEIRNKIMELSETYGLKINLDAKIWQLSIGEQQRVEILKTLYRDVRILILDEPTSVLTPLESEDLFKSIKKMANTGKSIILITHRLDEALKASDSITILRKGRVVAADIKPSEASRIDLVSMIVGKVLEFKPKAGEVIKEAKPVLEVDDLRVLDDRGIVAVDGVSFVLREGEILGVAGVAGNGQRELVEAITGLRKVAGGSIKMFGVDVTNSPPNKIIKMSVAHIPEDRLRYGVATELSVSDNLIMKLHKRFSRGVFMDNKAIGKEAERLIQEFEIVTPSANAPVNMISGGNIQKLIIARELSIKPKILIASNPTSGLDVASTNYVHWVFHRLRASGSSILLVSEDLDEILSLSNRIIVMKNGRIVKEFDRNVTVNEIGLAMAAGEAYDERMRNKVSGA